MERHTKYEQARLIGSRALQIAMGAPFFVKISGDDLEKIGFNPIEIAKREFAAGVLPLSIKRVTPAQRRAAEEARQPKKDAKAEKKD
jgi:DNA-directed RNA polymerase subunit K/omega